MRSYAMLAPRGWGALGGGLGTLLLGFYTLNLLLLVLGTAVTGFVLLAALLFCATTRGFGSSGFVYDRFQNSTEVTVGDLGSMGLRLVHHGRSGYHAEIFDSHPDSLEIVAGSPRLRTWWAPRAEQRLVYVFRAVRRGAFTLGPTVVIAHEPFGFAFRVCTVENPWTVNAPLRVPLVASGPSAFDQARRIEGGLNLPIRGRGTEFRSLRDYQSSDDIRTVAWKRSAMGRLYVREFERETPQDVVLVIDTSGRMGAGLVGQTALDRAVETAALVTRYSLLRGDKVGLLLTPYPAGGFVSVGRGTDVAAAIRKGLTGASPGPAPFEPATAFELLEPRLSRPAHLLVFSAPAQWTERDTFAFRHLVGRGHRAYFFVPDIPAMYPDPVDGTSRRTAALVDSPERERRDRVVAAIEALGAPIFVYGREGPVEVMADLADLIRGFRRGS